MNNNLWIKSSLLHTRILQRLNAIDKSQRELPGRLNINRSTLFRMSKNKTITMETFLNVIHWLDEDPNKFIFRGKLSLHDIKRQEKSRKKYDKIY